MGILIKILENMFYEVNVRCKNCGHKETVKIMKGTEVENGLKHKDCSHCGTKNLVQTI